MGITLLVTRGPASRASLRSAELARALQETGETITRVFFQGDGVHLCCAAGETDPHGAASLWQSLITEQALPATACSGSVHQRHLQQTDLAPGIELAGMGQLADAMATATRLVSF